MNKFAKVLSVVLSATIALSVCVVMLVSSLAAATPTFSLNVVEEKNDYVIVSVKLDSGAITSLEFDVKGSGNVGKCAYIMTTDAYDSAEKQVKMEPNGAAVSTTNATGSEGRFGAAYTPAFAKTGVEIVTCKFEKNTAEKVSNKDLTLVVTTCNDGDGNAVTAKAVNNVPAPVAPTTKSTTEPTTKPTTKPTTEPTTKKTEPSTEKTEPSTEKTEPSTEKTEPSTEKTEPSTEKTEPSTEKTEPSTEKTEPSTEATEPSTEKTEPSTEATEPSTEPSTEATEATTEATEPSTEATEPSTEATEPSTEATEATENDDVDVTEAPATDATEATTAVDGDVVNPNTGDSATATAAIASLLALSAAAVVALRKKED